MTDKVTPERRPALLPAMIGGKCPACRRGYVWQQRGIFPLDRLLRLHSHCPHCGQKLVHERNNGGGINYALTIMLIFLNLLWYWPIFGLSYKDNSIYYFLAASIGVVCMLQPFLMRLSRMIYLYLFISYGKGAMQ